MRALEAYRLSGGGHLTIRPMTDADAPTVARLTGLLGYPALDEEIARRFTVIRARSDHAVLLAEAPDGVLGWVHVRTACDLERPSHAVIEGLVVSTAARRLGVATALTARAEDWAAAAGLPFIRLYSQVSRTDAHAFYARQGYQWVATSHQFRKELQG